MFEHLPKKHFKVIYADVPWTFVTRSQKGKGKSPEQHYDCMTIDDIKAMPVAELAADDCALMFWATDPHLKLAFEVIEAWGFKYSTVGLYWAKLNRKSEGFFCGMGYWTRANPEQCLLATRGRPQRQSKGVRKLITDDAPKLITSPVREHSRKPDEAYDRIEALLPGPYLELFARTERPGWTAWGNQTQRFSHKELNHGASPQA